MDYIPMGSDAFADLTLSITMSHLVDHGADWRETTTKAGYTFWNI